MFHVSSFNGVGVCFSDGEASFLSGGRGCPMQGLPYWGIGYVLSLPLFSICAQFVNLLAVLKDARHYKDQFLTKPNKLLYTSLSDEITVGWDYFNDHAGG